MNYYKWRRKIKACAMLFLMSSYVLCLFLLNEIVVFQATNYIPVEIKYPLSAVPENQVVLAIRIWNNGFSISSISYMFLMNKNGNWKLIGEDIYDTYDIYDNSFSYESILQDENIPWQNTKIAINQDLLERAINMSDLESKCHFEYADDLYSGIVLQPLQGGKCIYSCLYYHGTSIKQDYTILYLQKKFKQLEELGLKAIEAQ